MILRDIGMIDLHNTFSCGQCFRWEETTDGTFMGVVGREAVTVRASEHSLIIDGSDNESFWRHYFDGDTDYVKIKQFLSERDEAVSKCINTGYDIRILNQLFFETLISFIISANNNIPRIKGIIERLCTAYGERIQYGKGEYYTFPSPERLCGISNLAEIRAGFRDKYILDAANKTASGDVDFNTLQNMDTDAARKLLMNIKGVGVKVADCVLLFGLGRKEVFPADVWIKRIMKDNYGIDEKDIRSFTEERFGSYSGIAQQYLFHHYRNII